MESVGEFSEIPVEAGGYFGQAEIQHLDRTVRFDLDITGLEVSMDDSLFVGAFQRAGNLLRNAQSFIQWQRTFRRFALDKLHHQVVGTDIVERTDIRMVQRGHRSGFALKEFTEARGGNFDGDVPSEPGIVRQIHFAHSPSADKPEDFVGTEFVA